MDGRLLLTCLPCLLTLQPITGMRLAGSIRLQTNVHVDTGTSSWLVPIGRIGDEQNATNATIAVVSRYQPSFLGSFVAYTIKVVFTVLAVALTLLAIGSYVKYWRQVHGLMMKRRNTSIKPQAATLPRRVCLRCGLCGPNRTQVVRRLHEMRHEEIDIMTPLLASGGPASANLQSQYTRKVETAARSRGEASRRKATGAEQIEKHFGQLEQLSSDESDDVEEEAAHASEVQALDLKVWDEFIGPPGRRCCARWANTLEVLPWVVWWVPTVAAGIIPTHDQHQIWYFRWTLADSQPGVLLCAALVSAIVVACQVTVRMCTPNKDRVFVLVPTVIDVATLVIFSVSALVAPFIANGHDHLWSFVTNGALLLTMVGCLLSGHPFIETVYCRELRPELWNQRFVTRAAEVVSLFWCAILLVVTALQSVLASGSTLESVAEFKDWVGITVPLGLLLIAMAITIWFLMQLEDDILRSLNRLLRKGLIESTRAPSPIRSLAPRVADTSSTSSIDSVVAIAPKHAQVQGMGVAGDIVVIPTLPPPGSPRHSRSSSVDSQPPTPTAVRAPTGPPLAGVASLAPAQLPPRLGQTEERQDDVSVEVATASPPRPARAPARESSPPVANRTRVAEANVHGRRIQDSVAAALAKSAQQSSEIESATSNPTPTSSPRPERSRLEERRGSVSSVSSDEFMDALAGDE